jgi:hypothetical protein
LQVGLATVNRDIHRIWRIKTKLTYSYASSWFAFAFDLIRYDSILYYTMKKIVHKMSLTVYASAPEAELILFYHYIIYLTLSIISRWPLSYLTAATGAILIAAAVRHTSILC